MSKSSHFIGQQWKLMVISGFNVDVSPSHNATPTLYDQYYSLIDDDPFHKKELL